MAGKAGPETVECVNCGSEIRKHASICHNCGVDNERKPGTSKVVESPDISDPESGGDLISVDEVSSQWKNLVIGSLSAWILAISLLSVNIDSGFVGLLIMMAWVGLPVSMFFDIHYVEENSEWDPNKLFWVGTSAIWFLNIMTASIYLLRRKENVQVIISKSSGT